MFKFRLQPDPMQNIESDLYFLRKEQKRLTGLFFMFSFHMQYCIGINMKDLVILYTHIYYVMQLSAFNGILRLVSHTDVPGM